MPVRISSSTQPNPAQLVSPSPLSSLCFHESRRKIPEGAPYSDDDSTDDVDSTTDFETGQETTVVAPMTGFQYVGCYEMEADHDPFSTLDQMNNMTLSVSEHICFRIQYVGQTRHA